jgi:1-acyl-sn-glycerol-3-phosphate acyltransferase
MTDGTRSLIWQPPVPWEILRAPVVSAGPVDRWLMRAIALLARRQVLSLSGIEHLRPAGDPIIVALNHSTRNEALLVPALLILHRGGRLIHFLVDWNFRLIPGVGFIYRRARTVSVMRKPARPRFLNALRPLYRHPLSAFEQARAHLLEGRAIGVFVEGVVNRDPTRLLPGRHGAARLSLETGAPIVPVGIRFPALAPGTRISDHAVMSVHIGAPLRPPATSRTPAMLADVRAWHATVMGAIAELSGKSWNPKSWSPKSWNPKPWIPKS